jgi:hypothetical protein
MAPGSKNLPQLYVTQLGLTPPMFGYSLAHLAWFRGE